MLCLIAVSSIFTWYSFCVCVCVHVITSIEISNRGSSSANIPIEPVFGPGSWYGPSSPHQGLVREFKNKQKTRDKLITVMNTARALATGELLCGRLWAVVFAGNNYMIVDFKFQSEFDETAIELWVYVSIEWMRLIISWWFECSLLYFVV